MTVTYGMISKTADKGRNSKYIKEILKPNNQLCFPS